MKDENMRIICKVNYDHDFKTAHECLIEGEKKTCC